MKIEPVAYDAEVEALLLRARLPVADMHEERAPDRSLFGIREGARLVAVVGIELHGPTGLLRSLAVEDNRRSKGFGRALVERAENEAADRGAADMYLLTVTAADYFARLGYRPIARADAPPAIAATDQFSTLCPASAVLMRKTVAPSR